MKNLYKTKIIILFTLLANVAISQNFNNFTKNLENNNMEELYAQLDSNVEVTILDKGSYNKDDAKELLAEFLSNKEMMNYRPIHKGAVGTEAYYQIGELKSQNRLYRTYLYSKKAMNGFLIQEIRIEKI